MPDFPSCLLKQLMSVVTILKGIELFCERQQQVACITLFYKIYCLVGAFGVAPWPSDFKPAVNNFTYGQESVYNSK